MSLDRRVGGFQRLDSFNSTAGAEKSKESQSTSLAAADHAHVPRGKCDGHNLPAADGHRNTSFRLAEVVSLKWEPANVGESPRPAKAISPGKVTEISRLSHPPVSVDFPDGSSFSFRNLTSIGTTNIESQEDRHVKTPHQRQIDSTNDSLLSNSR